MISIFGRHARRIVLPSHSGRDIVIMLVCAAILAGLVALPVLGDKLFDSVTPRAAKATPVTCLLGLGVLIVGIIAGVWILIVAGACLVGGVLLGAIMVHY